MKTMKIGRHAMKDIHSMEILEKRAMMNGTHSTKDIHSMKIKEKRAKMNGLYAMKDKGMFTHRAVQSRLLQEKHQSQSLKVPGNNRGLRCDARHTSTA